MNKEIYNIMFRKLLCKIGWHKYYELIDIKIRPIFIYPNNEQIVLPSFTEIRWKCNFCLKEKPFKYDL